MEKHYLPLVFALGISLILAVAYFDSDLINLQGMVIFDQKNESAEEKSSMENYPGKTKSDRVFYEDFEGDLSNWKTSLCTANSEQTCSLKKTNSPESVYSDKMWGRVSISDSVPTLASNCSRNNEVRFTNPNVSIPITGKYYISAAIHTDGCDICDIYSDVYLDDGLIFSRKGYNLSQNEKPLPAFFENTTRFLDSGLHNITIGMRSTMICNGSFDATFDHLAITMAQ